MKKTFALIALLIALTSCASPEQSREIAQEKCGDNYFVDYYTQVQNVDRCNGF